jgi:hypothetical protein
MKATEVTRRYRDTWNGRDADALVDGTYCSPDTHPGIGGEALANFVKGVWTKALGGYLPGTPRLP